MFAHQCGEDARAAAGLQREFQTPEFGSRFDTAALSKMPTEPEVFSDSLISLAALSRKVDATPRRIRALVARGYIVPTARAGAVLLFHPNDIHLWRRAVQTVIL